MMIARGRRHQRVQYGTAVDTTMGGWLYLLPELATFVSVRKELLKPQALRRRLELKLGHPTRGARPAIISVTGWSCSEMLE